MSSGSTATATVLLKKRERTQNWVPEEKNVLFSLIKSHAGAIENKKIDAAASAMKTLAWQQIYRSFRARFSTERDITRMREQWRRMKAQARIEMYTFAEKVKTLGPEEASKSRPSNLSIEVWRLMEKARKNEGEVDRSDESSQEFQDNATNLHTILDKLTSASLETSVREIKLERNRDAYNTDDEESQNGSLQKRNNSVRKKRSRSHSAEPIDLVERKLSKMSDAFQQSDNNVEESNDLHDDKINACSHLPDETNELNTDRDLSLRSTNFILEAAHKEHNLKIKMLNMELERAELQKRAAINELKASEMKRRLIEDQTAEYYSQVRMIGERGSGAGKGGGGGGSIREAGGSFGKMEAAHEDQYFYNQQKEQLQKMRDGLHDEISFHEEQIKRHQEAINRHKKRITDMNDKE